MTFLIAGCNVLSPAPPTDRATPVPAFAATVDTPDGVVGVLRTATFVRLAFVDGGGGSGHQIAGPAPNIYLMSQGGETGTVYNSFVYGVAPLGAASFELVGVDTPLGGAVRNGMFVLVFKDKDYSPDLLHWTFRSGNGTVIASGSGIRP